VEDFFSCPAHLGLNRPGSNRCFKLYCPRRIQRQWRGLEENLSRRRNFWQSKRSLRSRTWINYPWNISDFSRLWFKRKRWNLKGQPKKITFSCKKFGKRLMICLLFLISPPSAI